jgi:uncharacterized RDD family membrane protein YckC
MESGYYILENGEQKGPFTLHELKELDIENHTSIQSPGDGAWQDACDLPELYPYFEARGVYLPTGDNLASFGWRLLAFIVDYLILSFLVSVVLVASNSFGLNLKVLSYADLLKLSSRDRVFLEFAVYASLVIYNCICEVSPLKGSIGKRAFKMVVVDVEGISPNFLVALLRSVGKVISLMFYGLGFISIFFTEHRQALHDLLAKTYVVKRN